MINFIIYLLQDYDITVDNHASPLLSCSNKYLNQQKQQVEQDAASKDTVQISQEFSGQYLYLG